jgi:hypothetical protein
LVSPRLESTVHKKAALRAALSGRETPEAVRDSTRRQSAQNETERQGNTDRFQRLFLHPRFGSLEDAARGLAHKPRLVGKTVGHMGGAAGQFVDAFVGRRRCTLHRAARRLGDFVNAAVKRRARGFDTALDGVVIGGGCCGFVHDASFKKIPQNTGAATIWI